MIIRFAEKKDKEQVLHLLDELGTHVNKVIGETETSANAQKIGAPTFNEIIERPDTMIFVADDNGTIVGLATFYLLPNIRHNWRRGHIEDFVVTETMRGKGVGSKLMTAIKDYCKEKNIKVLKLDSSNELTDAHSFYTKQGGKQTEKMFRFDIE